MCGLARPRTHTAAHPGELHTHSSPLPQLTLHSAFGLVSCACGETGRSMGNRGRKTIIDNSHWVHSTSALTATGFLICLLPPLPPQLCFPPHPQPTDQKIFAFLLPPFLVVILAEFMKKR